jgi:hypothetical protein
MRRPRLLLTLAVASLAACTDRDPPSSPEAPLPLPPSAVAAMTCTVSVRAGTLSCGAPGAGPDASAAVLGGQGTNVRLTSTGMSYDGTSTFRMDVTLENLTGQALGTADGVTPSPDGVRIFFFDGPAATGGDGPVAVANADGEDIFTGPGQKYFQYDGILAPGETSGAREWLFTLPSTVTSFGFKVYVHAPVRAEEGWIGMAPVAGAVAVGDTQRVTGTVRSVTGGVAGGTVAWSTSNPAVATVDDRGLVTGVAAGTATITATSGARTGSVQVLVHAPAFDPPPTFLVFRLEGASVTSGSPADSVKFRLEYRNSGGFSPYIRVMMRHATGIQRECVSHTGYGWVGDNREMWCGFGMPDGILGGAWKVDRIEFSGRTVQHAALLAAGAPAYVHVHTTDEDREAPTLDSLVVQTDTADENNGWYFNMNLWAGDRMYTDRAEVFIGSAGNATLASFGISGTAENGRTPYQFSRQIPQYYQPGTFRLDSLRLRDVNGNRRTITKAELTARGYRTEFIVTGTTPDTVPPTITAFSFTPRTMVGTGADSVTVTLTATEPQEESGVWFLDMEFEKIGDASQRRRCLLNGAGRVFTRTMTCKQAFGSGDMGTWYVRYIRAIDFKNNSRELNNTQLQQGGYPERLVVTGPNPDTIPPRIAAFSFSPQTVAGNGADSVSVTLTATEPAGESGVWFMDLVFERVSNTAETRRCLVNPTTVEFTRTLTCRQAFAAGDAGEWRVRYIRAIDYMNNTQLLRTPALQEAGYPTQLTITPP